MTTKWVYSFGKDKNEGDATMRNLLGGKGSNLAEMSGLGLPVPPGFTITTEVCSAYYDNGENYPAELDAQMEEALAQIESTMDMKFGDSENPPSCLCSLWRACVDAGHDGYGFEPWFE